MDRLRRLWASRRPVGVERWLLPFVLVTALTAASSPNADAGLWIQNLSPSGELAYSPQLDVDADGDAVVVWEARSAWDDPDSEVKARGRSGGGLLSVVQTLSGPGQPAGPWPQVAVDADGDALVAWDLAIPFGQPGESHVYARARSAAASLSAVDAVSGEVQEALRPTVAMDGSGRAVVAWAAWDQTNWRVYARARSAAGVWSSVEPVSEAAGVRGDPQVVMDGQGRAVVVWAGREGAIWRAYARVRSAAGTWSDAMTLSPAGENVLAWPQAATNDDGDAVVVWGLEVPCCLSLWQLQARGLSPAGTWSSTGEIGIANEDFTPPQVAVAGDGGAFIVWRARDAGGSMRIQGRSRSPAGVFSQVRALSPPGQDSLSRDLGSERAQIAMSENGWGVVVWSRRFPAWGDDQWRVQARVRSPSGVLFSVETLSPVGGDGNDPQVAVDGSGRALAVWQRYGGVQAAVIPPDTRITKGPAGTTTKRRAVFRFIATERGSTFRCRLDHRKWRRCSSPKTYSRLALGSHVFRVAAIGGSGQGDPTAAKRVFRVLHG